MKRYWIVFIFNIFLSLSLLYFVNSFIQNDIKNLILKEISAHDEITAFEIKNFKKDESSLLRMLQKNPAVDKCFQSHKCSFDDSRLFYDIVDSKQDIMQLRVISLNGDELIRIDRKRDGRIKQVPAADLQNKYDRDYFQNFMKLKNNEIGFSKFDLNVEHQKIEIPFNPTLRAAIPVFIGGEKAGIVVINYYMKKWFEKLGNISNADLYIIDEDGYFLLNKDPSWEWSRYQTPPKKANELFNTDLDYHKIYELKDPTWISDTLIASPLRLFNSKLISIYEPKIDQKKLVFSKILEFSLILLIVLILLLAPIVKILHLLYIKLKNEKFLSQRNETYLNNVFNNSFDAIVIIDKDAIIQKVNLVATEIFGYSADELIGKNVNILVPEPHHSIHDDYVKNYKSSMKKILGNDRDLNALKKDGTLFPISLAITQMLIDQKVYFIGTLRDLTNIKKLQEMQKEKESMLLHQSKLASMGEMLGAIAHQWRQPLNSIGLIVQDLSSAYKHNDLSEEYFQKSKEEVFEQLKFMSSTIDQFRKFFTDDMKYETTNLIKITEDVYNLYRAQLKEHNITLEIFCMDKNGQEHSCHLGEENSLDLRMYNIDSIASDIKQLLLNLVANVKDAIDVLENADENERTVSIHLLQDENNFIIQVKDMAGGIAQNIRDRVFEPYFTSKEMGTGLGLFIAQTLTSNRLKGQLDFNIDEYKINGKKYTGTTFILKLPKTIS